MAHPVLPPMDEEVEANLVPLEPKKSNMHCFLCEYGTSQATQAKQLIAQVRTIIDESIGKRCLDDICDDVVEFYNGHIRQCVEGNPEWSKQSVEEHILRTETNMDVALELDKRSVTQILQRLREKMVDETTDELYMPNCQMYLKVSQHLQKLCTSMKSGAQHR
jgi:pyruvate carboxylase